MLKRSTVIAIDLFLVLFNLGVASFHALCIYGGDLRRAALVGMIGSVCMGIVMLLVTRWYLRECARQDREIASLLMRKVGEIDDQIIAEFGKSDPNRPKSSR